MARIVLCNWRVTEGEPSGLHVWFDPSRERVEIHALEPPSEDGVSAAVDKDDHETGSTAPGQVTGPSSLEGLLPF